MLLKKRKIIFGLLLVLIYYFPPVSAKAVDFDRANNKFGIHLAQPAGKDLKAAAELVNSNGGDWGYLTLVLQENDRDKEKWQAVFDQLRQLHLIPLIRLATRPQGSIWQKPSKKEVGDWVDFLDSLNWVVKDRYVILFNEPNHGREWGGRVDPVDYGQLALEFAKRLKEKNSDFFIMLAGFDSSAPSNPPGYEDEVVFLEKMTKAVPNLFRDFVDGWASHSYPQDFVGSPLAYGRRSVRTYQWEVQVLRRLGVKKALPIFITETGWYNKNRNAGENFSLAFRKVWLPDQRVRAVTPFILNYQGFPFEKFSWRRFNQDGFYPHYYMVKGLKKRAGEPQIVDKGEIRLNFPNKLVVSSAYHFQLWLKNNGQAIWGEDGGYSLLVKDEKKTKLEYFFSDINQLKPGEEKKVDFYFKTKNKPGRNQIRLFLVKDEERTIVESSPWEFKLLPFPGLRFKIGLYPKPRVNDNGFEIQIFDPDEQLILKRKNLKVKNGRGRVKGIKNIVFGKKYRVVVLKPYYLPRQSHIVFKKTDKDKPRVDEEIEFIPMIPVDFHVDGRFDWQDLIALIKNPRLFSLFIPW